MTPRVRVNGRISVLRATRRALAPTAEAGVRAVPVGGIKEKMLAAHRAGIRGVILPSLNERNMEDAPEELRRELHFIFVDDAEACPHTGLGGGTPVTG